jgi:hypothetical protein
MNWKAILRLKCIGIVLITVILMIPAVKVFAHGHGKDGLSCQDLTSLRMGRVEIVSATEVADTGVIPPYCEVKGVIDKEINFTLLLPTPADWNGKFLMGGGGGFVAGVSNSAMSPSPFGNAIQRGYATSGTDTGHPATDFGMTWAFHNKKRQLNFAYEAVHITAEVSKDIISRYYGERIKHSYFIGCSTGGRQGMMESQHFPMDFDGVVSGAPSFHWTGQVLSSIWQMQHMYPGQGNLTAPVLPMAKLQFLGQAIYNNCDATDGLADGIITDPSKCTFDPHYDLTKCPDGSDGPGCFTNAQIDVIQKIYDGPSNSRGQLYPGWPVGSEAFGFGWNFSMVGPVPPFFGLGPYPNLSYFFANEILRYHVYSDPEYDLHEFNLERNVPDMHPVGAVMNATNPNLRPFKNHGGKLIMYHGYADPLVNPARSIQYIEEVRGKMGKRADDVARLFMLPGVSHCSGGVGPDTVDWISYLEKWVEGEQAPEEIKAYQYSDPNYTTVTRTRPLCPYPKVARYKGKGDIDDAENFTCQEQ